jgi:hypothetical protein
MKRMVTIKVVMIMPILKVEHLKATNLSKVMISIDVVNHNSHHKNVNKVTTEKNLEHLKGKTQTKKTLDFNRKTITPIEDPNTTLSHKVKTPNDYKKLWQIINLSEQNHILQMIIPKEHNRIHRQKTNLNKNNLKKPKKMIVRNDDCHKHE